MYLICWNKLSRNFKVVYNYCKMKSVDRALLQTSMSRLFTHFGIFLMVGILHFCDKLTKFVEIANEYVNDVVLMMIMNTDDDDYYFYHHFIYDSDTITAISS